MKTFIISIKIFLFFTILTGIVYPLLVTGIAQLSFPKKANGSLIFKHHKLVGSELIGQQFDSAIYFTSRPSAISYHPLPSGGSNYSLTNTKLKESIAERKKKFIAFNLLDSLTDIPSEMLFASASGLDPHISPKAALMQVKRIVRARNFSTSQQQQQQQLIDLILKTEEMPQYGILGEKRINVLLLNIKLDEMK